jgi:hypothetical protein
MEGHNAAQVDFIVQTVHVVAPFYHSPDLHLIPFMTFMTREWEDVV